MASAYRVRDATTGQELALKLLTIKAEAHKAARAIELFEGEFHTLTQLAHPRTVRAFDYGVDQGQPYYTMEILDGGDLHELSPLPWQDVCTIAYEICSVLSLLHSRRLVHRDLTPRNIRRTADGRAKLLDFGLLAPMGATGLLAGTPPYVAPELVQSMTLDGRSDLFSLGATLYHALTGRTAFPARSFDQLRDLWRSNPAPPSRVVAGIPAAVDELVLSLLRIDLGSRPKSAAEVMDRLLPLLPHPPDPELNGSRAFLATPQLVGRDEVVIQFRKRAVSTVRSQGGGFILLGAPGTGRSRMLDAFVLEAKLVGASTLRAGVAEAALGPFGVANALAAQLHAAVPAVSQAVAQDDPKIYAALFGAAPANANSEPQPAPLLRDFTLAEDRAALHAALRAWLLEIARRRPLAIAIDDFDRIDEPSAAWLASLAWEAPEHRLLYAVTLADAAVSGTQSASRALSVLRTHASEIELAPLSLEGTTRLLGSVFGNVPNLQAFSSALHALSAGRPKDCMGLAQSLVNQGAITCAGGTWMLPAAISPGLLPSGVEAALERNVAALNPVARRVLLALALDVRGRLSRAAMRLFEGVEARALDAALDDLRAAQMISGHSAGYMLCHGALARVALGSASADDQASCHDELARIYEQSASSTISVAYHRLHGRRPEQGLDYLLACTPDTAARTRLTEDAVVQITGGATARTFERALDVAEQHGRPQRERMVLWALLAAMSARGEDHRYYRRVPPDWLERLKLDSGYDDFRKQDPALDAMARLSSAFAAATERYNATPEHERVLPPLDAIKQLVSYVVFSISVSVQALDLELQETLPALLEPFAPVSPVVRAMFGNARATRLSGQGKLEQARGVSVGVLEMLATITPAEFPYVAKVQASIEQSIAESDASLGLRSSYTAALENPVQDPNQAAGAEYIRKVLALQQGDWEAAEKHRQQAELLSLQGCAQPMFSTLRQELEAHALARDLTGLKQVRTAIHARAQNFPGWKPLMHLADAQFLLLCGDLEGALREAGVARQLGSAGKLRSPWIFAAIMLEAELMIALGRPEEAYAHAHPALLECQREGMHGRVRSLACTLALAEAKQGDTAAGLARIDAVIAEQTKLGVTALLLGASYECAARIAIEMRSLELFERYASLAAEQYRAGHSSVLGALYERLLEEARRAGLIDAAHSDANALAEAVRVATSWSRVTTAMAGCDDGGDRAQRALALLCDAELSRGHLFLFTRAGLTLVASNTSCQQLREFSAFTKSYLESQRRAADLDDSSDECDMTLDTDSQPGEWRDVDGTRYGAVVLRAKLDGELQIVGVAMLSGLNDAQRSALHSLTTALATKLLESGDFLAA
jgi:eukaryotic-like serine/threonine-protein kinase